MTQLRIVAASAAADTAGLANNITGTSGTALVLAATDSGDDLAHPLIITNNSANDYSAGGKAFAIVGTNANGEPQTESLVGPAASVTTTSTKYWLGYTSITPNFTSAAAAFDVGWTVDSVSPWEFINYPWGPQGLGFGCTVDSGSPTYTVQHQYGDGTAQNHSSLAGETTNQSGSYVAPVRAVRLSFAAAGNVTLNGQY